MGILDVLKTGWGRLMRSVTSATNAFRKEYLSADIIDPEDFSDYDARRFRYDFYWAFFENSAYQELVHQWGKTYKTQEGLYRYIRGIYNSATRICNFQHDHIWAGRLEVKDGLAMPSGALPIETENENLRLAIGTLWRASNWQAQKDLTTLWGSVYGDVGIMVVDDVRRGKVSLRIVNPGNLLEVERDFSGNVKGYTFEEVRLSGDEDSPSQEVTYREVVERDGESVIYRTYKDGEPYAWNSDTAGNPVSEWAIPYSFIPLVVIPHIDVGLDWGFSELHTGRTKFAEIDDIASKLNDQIRKIVHSKWLASGMDDPAKRKGTLQMTEATPTTNKPQPGREEEYIIYAPDGGSMQALVAPLPISDTGNEIARMLDALGDDYPELMLIKMTTRGQLSGVALDIARGPVKDKVLERRGRYDDFLVRIQQMAVAIGGMRGYPGYEGFSLESYKNGELEHSIGKRPIFESTMLQDLESFEILWRAAGLAGQAGVGIEVFLREIGWDDERIGRVMESQEFQSRQASMRAGLIMNDEEG